MDRNWIELLGKKKKKKKSPRSSKTYINNYRAIFQRNERVSNLIVATIECSDSNAYIVFVLFDQVFLRRSKLDSTRTRFFTRSNVESNENIWTLV